MKIIFKHEIKQVDKVNSDEIVDILLKNRKVKNLNEFLNPTDPAQISLTDFNPGIKTKLEKTLKLLEKIKKDKGMIVVYTDYDADGITGGAILWETLHLLGFKTMPYVPHRKLEGYGFSKKGIDNAKKLYNPSLIISVDHGITAKEKVTYAKKLGIPIIITDHHLKPNKLPDDAEAIFHVPELSGSGVAFFFAKEIFAHFYKLQRDRTSAVSSYAKASEDKEEKDGLDHRSFSEGGKTAEVKIDWQKLENNFSSDYLSLASIGTIADLVPLLGPSRSVAKHGLDAFSKIKRTGLKHILQQAGIMGKKITPYEVGFIMSPRINAVGRLEHAIDALRLLCTTNDDKAYELASRVGNTNRERQDLVMKSVEEAKNMVKVKTSNFKKLQKIIIIKNANFHEGIIGLIASKIAEEYYRPTIVLTESDGFWKGSARSIPGFHITNFLRENKKYLIDVGGHVGAAGFTMEKKNFSIFSTTVDKLATKALKVKDLERTIEADVKVPLAKLNLSIAKRLELLQPFGIGNPKPTFLSEVEVIDTRTFGKTNDHLKLYVRDSHNPFPFEMISFSNGKKVKDLSKAQKINVIYNLEVDRWSGSEKLRGKIIHLQ